MPFVTRVRKSISSRAQKAASKILQVRYGQCAVLLYHRVANLQSDPQELSVTLENFEAQLQILKKEFHLLTVAEFKNHILTSEAFPRKSVLITFDDGYADNFLYALPILEKVYVESLFYICTGNIDTTNEFWWDELELLLLRTDQFPESISFDFKTESYSCTKDLKSRQLLYNALLPELRRMNFTSREKVFEELRNKIMHPPPRSLYRTMTTSELKKLSESSIVTIGAHTVNHCSLGSLNANEQRNEISQSISRVESIIGKSIEDFSYPFGTYRDFNKDTVAICKDLKMKWVAANFPGCVHAKSSTFSFPRFLVRNWNQEDFRTHVNSFLKK